MTNRITVGQKCRSPEKYLRSSPAIRFNVTLGNQGGSGQNGIYVYSRAYVRSPIGPWSLLIRGVRSCRQARRG